MSKTERLFHPRTLVIHPDFKNLEEFIVSIPERFQRNEGTVIHQGRNELRKMEYNGKEYAAECAGAHGVVIPKRRSAGLTSIVAKTSAGAVSYVPVARVPNIPALLEQLQKEGVWVFGTAAEGTSDLYSADLKGPAAIVIGSEGDGMTRLVREKCDFLVSIPMKGKISSLNASAAAAILLYEAVRQRLGQ